jgi:hypothetical protein
LNDANSAFILRPSSRYQERQEKPVNYTPKPEDKFTFGLWTHQLVEVMQRWTETQQTLWQRSFEMIKQADPTTMGSNWGAEAHKVAQAWQEAAQKALETQQEWVCRLAAAQTQQKAE